MRGNLETLVAEPKMSARFLAVMPVILFLVLGAVNPQFMHPLTSTSAGHLILTVAAISIAFGYVIMMKLADVDI
jgi:tight adherence protein B